MWGVYIITFVFWVGIGHAGTLISAILYLFRAGFRTSIYRVSEAMTVFAVMTAGLFPILHLGRPWKFFYLIPYPNWRLIWPNPKSPLVWDVFAILTYLTISSTFLYIGLIPDIAILRDREKNPMRKSILAMLSLGWRNSDREWRHFTRAYLFLAAFATPLVLSVHSVVSFDFAMALTPGLARDDLPAVLRRRRDLLRHRHGVHDRHSAAQVRSSSSTTSRSTTSTRRPSSACSRRCVVGLAYLTEFQVAWMSGNKFEQDYFWNRVFGQWAWAAWIMLICNMVLPLSLFSQKLRRNTTWLFILSLFINLGMWFERFVIVVPSLSHEFEPWQWGTYRPTWVDYGILLGSFGWFFMWFLLFIKQLPVMAMAEIKEVRAAARCRHSHDWAHDLTDGSDRPRRDGSGPLMQGVLGAFHELDSAVHAIEDLKKAEARRHHGVHADAAPRVRARAEARPEQGARRSR